MAREELESDAATIEEAVRSFFESDEAKVRAWFETPNPHLGNLVPRVLMEHPDTMWRLKKFVLHAAEAEVAARELRQRIEREFDERLTVLNGPDSRAKLDSMLLARGKLNPMKQPIAGQEVDPTDRGS